jgi:hypothetical protein
MTLEERKEIHKQHIALDLYYQAKRTALELNEIINCLSDRKEKLDMQLSRFEGANELNKDVKLDIDTMILNKCKTLSTKKQVKAYKKYLKTLTSSSDENK